MANYYVRRGVRCQVRLGNLPWADHTTKRETGFDSYHLADDRVSMVFEQHGWFLKGRPRYVSRLPTRPPRRRREFVPQIETNLPPTPAHLEA